MVHLLYIHPFVNANSLYKNVQQMNKEMIFILFLMSESGPECPTISLSRLCRVAHDDAALKFEQKSPSPLTTIVYPDSGDCAWLHLVQWNWSAILFRVGAAISALITSKHYNDSYKYRKRQLFFTFFSIFFFFKWRRSKKEKIQVTKQSCKNRPKKLK